MLDLITVERNISRFTLRDHKLSQSGLRRPADKRVSGKDANRLRNKLQRLQLYIRSRGSEKVTYPFEVVQRLGGITYLRHGLAAGRGG